MFFQILLCYFVIFMSLWFVILVTFHQTDVKITQLKKLEEGNVKEHFQRLLAQTGIVEHHGCPLCRITADVFLNAIKLKVSDAFLKNISRPLCQVLEIDDQQMCSDLININFDIAKYVISVQPNLTGELVCGILLQDHNCYFEDTTPDWSVKINEKYPIIISSKHFVPVVGFDQLTIVHITDTHLDTEYVTGSNAACITPVCCHDNLSSIDSTDNAAGKWGDFRNCDTPWLVVENTINQIKNTHKQIDAIYATGDYVDHAVWASNINRNIAVIDKTIKAIRQQFPGVAFFPILGNHEPHPANIITPNKFNRTEFSSQSLYEHVSKSWHWLPESARRTLKYGGYYTALIQPGFRVIALNNNACIQFNFWILLDSSFLVEELQWLHDTLLKAERNHEKVHILAHVPSGDDNCYKRWAREYKRIIERFWNTISGQFYGHAHKDQFHLYYEKNNSKHAINVAWNGGSVTPYSFVNPNYKTYLVESESFQVIDHDTWIYNLTEANSNPYKNPRWFKEYSFREAFNVPNLSAATLNNLIKNFARNHTKLELYWKYSVKMSDPLLQQGCDKKCLAQTLCRIVTTEYQDPQCNKLLALFSKSISD